MKLLAPLFLLALLVGCDAPKSENTGNQPSGETKPEAAVQEPAKENFVGSVSTLADALPLKGEEVAVIDTKFGKITVRFYRDKAPGHVKNFMDLAKKGFYDGTKFHRTIKGFMIQGGDPLSKDSDPTNDGQGGPGYNVKAEFNEMAHVRGILSMARGGDPDSAGSQFFLMHGDNSSLDTQYTVFGRICKDGTEKGDEPAGLAVVDKIVTQPVNGEIAKDPIPMKVKIITWPN